MAISGIREALWMVNESLMKRFPEPRSSHHAAQGLIQHQKSKFTPIFARVIHLHFHKVYLRASVQPTICPTFLCHSPFLLSSYQYSVMDFSQLNSAEQAQMTKIIEKKQVLVRHVRFSRV